MLEPTSEQYIHWYKCLSEITNILEFDKIIKAFYCGKRIKWGIPNCFLVVIEEDRNNRFFEEMSCEGGSTGSGYLIDKKTGKCLGGNLPWGHDNRKNAFHYKVITDIVYDQLKNDWSKLNDDSWHQAVGNIGGVEIDLELMKRFYDNKTFI
jgi:hypothetical protein